MASTIRRGVLAALFLTAATFGSAAQAQMNTVITRPDGTRIETEVLGPTNIRVTLSGGTEFQSPLTVHYTNISYSATEIVYQGTVSFRGTTEAVTCRVNTATGAVSGSGACQNSLGGSGTTTDTTTDTTTTTTGSDETTVVITGTNSADQARAWINSGVLGSLLPGNSLVTALQSLTTVQATGLDPVFAAIQSLASDVDRAAAVQQLAPANPSATATSAVATAKAVAETVLGRTLTVRGGTGVSTGDLTSGFGLWAQPFGYRARQDRRDGQDGYEDRTLGIAIGGDTAVSDRVRVGLALSYADTGIDGRDASSGDSTDGRSGHVSLYAQYEGDRYYVVGQVSGGISGYDGRRAIGFAGLAADSDYNGWQVGARVDGGLPLAVGGGWQVTPMAGLSYLHSHVDGYTESGAGALNLTVEDSRNNSLTGSLGARVSYDSTVDGTTWTPFLQAVASYDFIGERPETTARFAPGGSSFVTQGADPARLGGDLTLGVTVLTAGSLSFTAAYTFGVREDYRVHGGGLRARFQY